MRRRRQDAHDKIATALEATASGLFNTAVPGIVSDSGNGGQAEFILTEPLEATPEIIEKAERAGRGIQHHFRKVLGADIAKVDSVWNIARVMRIPGTVNFPNARQAQAGPGRAWRRS